MRGAILLAIGFVVGSVVAAGTITLAMMGTQGRLSQDVIQRPVIRTWAAIYVAACGIVGALFAYSP